VLTEHEMADVVQEGGDDQRGRCVLGPRQLGGLERVLELGDTLVVPVPSTRFEEPEQPGEERVGRRHRGTPSSP
jgi:hypothetical protein